jgi:tetratricopeptide (TPR) repeat protein
VNPPRQGPTPAQAFEMAVSLHRQGRLAEAERAYRAILRVIPGHFASLNYLGICCSQQGRPQEAELILRQALAINPQAAEVHNNLGVALAALGRRADAAKEYEQAIAAQPSHVEALNNLGLLHLSAQRPNEAAALFEKALSQRPGSPEVHCNLGNALAALKRHDSAISHYQQALSLKPDGAEAHHNLGIALAAVDRRQEAVASFEKAISLKPAYAAAHGQLAKVLGELGRYDEAIGHAQAALAANDNVAETHNDLGNLLVGQGRHAEAIVHYQKALALKPDFAEPHNNLGNVYVALLRYDKALAHFEMALALKPDFAAAMTNLGRALSEVHRIEEALIWYQKAVALHPDMAAVHVRLGDILQSLGRLDEARSAYETAVKLAPTNGGYYRSLSEAKRFTADDAHLADMEGLAQSLESLSQNDQIGLHFALGKAYADLDRHQDAFDHYLKGNTLKRGQLNYDEAASLTRLERIQTVISADLVQHRHDGGEPSDLPVFIVGMYRSGTSLVEQVLASHPQVFGGGELRDLPQLLSEIDRKHAGRGAFPELIPELAGSELRQLAADYLKRVRAFGQAAERITDKMPANFALVGLIYLILPGAHIIHVRRDPVDTCWSCYTHLFARTALNWSYDLGELGRYYRAYASLMDHWRRVLPAGFMLEVQYEDLIAEFEPQAKRLVEFCRLNWDERCLAFHKTERAVSTASAAQVRQPIYRSAVGRWLPYKEMLGPLLTELSRA